MKKQEQIDIVRKMIADGVVTQEQAAKYFPELAEGEDERTWIINYLSNRILNSTIIAEKENSKKAIAWLERQGEKDEEILILKDQIESLHAAIKAIKETHRIVIEKQGEQKPADKVEQKGMNIVEEDMTPFQKKVFCIIDTTIEEEQGLKQVCDELLRLAHDEIMQKLAWSEKDEKMLSDIVKDLVHPWNEYIPDRIEDEIKWLKNRLKSLMPQSTWKPSEEMLEALYRAVPQNVKEMSEDKILLDKLYHGLKYGIVVK